MLKHFFNLDTAMLESILSYKYDLLNAPKGNISKEEIQKIKITLNKTETK